MPNEVRIWDGDEWVLVSGITGGAGATGAPGEDSMVPGPRGSKWYTGAGAPDVVPLSQWSPSGVDTPPQPGDFYLNTATGVYSEMT